jgi:hypothetical protein
VSNGMMDDDLGHYSKKMVLPEGKKQNQIKYLHDICLRF